MSWAFSQVAGLLWVLQVRRPLSGGAAGVKVATPGSGTASASRVAAAQGAPKRSGDDEGGGAKRRVPWLSACPARGRCALLAPVSWPAGRVAACGGGLLVLPGHLSVGVRS